MCLKIYICNKITNQFITVPLPDHAFKQILDDKMRLSYSDQQSDMSPCELLTVQQHNN